MPQHDIRKYGPTAKRKCIRLLEHAPIAHEEPDPDGSVAHVSNHK